jgi:hypothetical protein
VKPFVLRSNFIEEQLMSLHNFAQSHNPSTPVTDGFKLKDGLFEYSKKVLTHSERDSALRWVQTHLPALDDDLREFMKLSEENNKEEARER